MRYLFLFLLFIGCQHPPTPTSFSQTIMTMQYRILVGDPLNSSDKVTVQRIIDDTFAEVDSLYNKWNPSSEISELNRLAAGTKKRLSPSLYTFLKNVDALVKTTEGRFDPTIEPLYQLWKEKLDAGKEPSQKEIDAIQPAIGWKNIHLEKGLFYKDHPFTQLDLGGIAKGYCVDLLVERLNQAGFANLFVEWGGEIRASGQHPTQRPWNIYISRLQDTDPSHAIAWISLTNEAIATSGDYFQSWTITTSDSGVKTYTHIINPQTLSPLQVRSGSIASTSVVAKDCLTADALATALMLFHTKEEAETWVAKLQLSCWMITRD